MKFGDKFQMVNILESMFKFVIYKSNEYWTSAHGWPYRRK